jgi:hypothetical protein
LLAQQGCIGELGTGWSEAGGWTPYHPGTDVLPLPVRAATSTTTGRSHDSSVDATGLTVEPTRSAFVLEAPRSTPCRGETMPEPGTDPTVMA